MNNFCSGLGITIVFLFLFQIVWKDKLEWGGSGGNSSQRSDQTRENLVVGIVFDYYQELEREQLLIIQRLSYLLLREQDFVKNCSSSLYDLNIIWNTTALAWNTKIVEFKDALKECWIGDKYGPLLNKNHPLITICYMGDVRPECPFYY